MPANKGAHPNWQPTPDFASAHVVSTPAAETERYPGSVDELTSELGRLSLPEHDCYVGETREAIIAEDADTYFALGRSVKQVVELMYADEEKPKEAEAVNQDALPTKIVVTMTHQDGTIEHTAVTQPPLSKLGA